MVSIDENVLAEFERMIDTSSRLDRKADLIKETEVLNRAINEIDDMINIYSTIDFIRVGELMGDRIRLNNRLLDVLSESNDLYLESIKKAI